MGRRLEQFLVGVEPSPLDKLIELDPPLLGRGATDLLVEFQLPSSARRSC